MLCRSEPSSSLRRARGSARRTRAEVPPEVGIEAVGGARALLLLRGRTALVQAATRDEVLAGRAGHGRDEDEDEEYDE